MKYICKLLILVIFSVSYSYANNIKWEKILNIQDVKLSAAGSKFIQIDNDLFLGLLTTYIHVPESHSFDFYIDIIKINIDGNLLNHTRRFHKNHSSNNMLYVFDVYQDSNLIYFYTFLGTMAGYSDPYFWRFDIGNFEFIDVKRDSTFVSLDTRYVYNDGKIIQFGFDRKIDNTLEPAIKVLDPDLNILENILIDTNGIDFQFTDYKNRFFEYRTPIATKDGNYFVYILSFNPTNGKILRPIPVKIDKNGKIIWSLYDEVLNINTQYFGVINAIELENGDIISKFVASDGHNMEGLIRISPDGKILNWTIFKDNDPNSVYYRFFSMFAMNYIEELNMFVLAGGQASIALPRTYNRVLIFLDEDFNIVYEYVEDNPTTFEYPYTEYLAYLGNNEYLIYGTDAQAGLPYIARFKLDLTNIEKPFKEYPRIVIYPQPAYDMINLNLEINVPQKIEIYDLNGLLIKEEMIYTERIYVGDLVSGSYLIVLGNIKLKILKI